MSLPGIFRRLFGNEGAGPKLLPEIIPPHADTHGAKGSDPITPESIGAARASASGGAASADVAKKLAVARTILVNLGVTTAASFDGSANATPGVSGTLPVAHGGTGRTDGKAVALATARTILVNLGATTAASFDGSVKFDGSADVTITATIIGLVPVGGIVAFSGTFSGRNPVDMKSKKAMTGWCLCDGTATNGLAVPDLRDRMIMGAGTTYKTGSKGGSASHTHSVSGTVGATTLTEAQLAAHSHETSRGNNTGDNRPYYQGAGTLQGSISTYDAGGSAPHAHSLSGVKSGSASSLPPYYALAFIMRIA